MRHLTTVKIFFALILATTAFIQAETVPQSSFHAIYTDFLNSRSDTVQVVAHRGDWHNVPENTLESIRNCIKTAIDIVEVDVRKTLDGHLILMHDTTVDRTTTGSGKVSELTLDQIKSLWLKNADNTVSQQQVPTLEAAMLLAKGKIMLNLDKSWPIRNECIKVLKKTNTTNHAIFKASGDPSVLKKEIKDLEIDINFIYIVYCKGSDKPSAESIFDAVHSLKPKAIEICFDNDKHPIMQPENVEKIRQCGSRVWVNSLWKGSLSGGHPDSNTDTWDWLIKRGITMIQTDSPQKLRQHLDNLKSKTLQKQAI